MNCAALRLRATTSVALIISIATAGVVFGSTEAGAATSTAAAVEAGADSTSSTAAASSGVDVFGLPVGAIAWMTIGLLALVVGLVASTRTERRALKVASGGIPPIFDVSSPAVDAAHAAAPAA